MTDSIIYLLPLNILVYVTAIHAATLQLCSITPKGYGNSLNDLYFPSMLAKESAQRPVSPYSWTDSKNFTHHPPINARSINISSITSLFNSNSLQATEEYQVKAAFLYKFIDYIKWNQAGNHPVFTIAVLGKSDVKDHLMEIASEKKINGKGIVVQQYESLNDVPENVQMVFISKRSSVYLSDVVNKYRHSPILIVTEEPGYAIKGSHINFILTDGKIKFEINLNALRKAGLDASAQLLKLAIIV